MEKGFLIFSGVSFLVGIIILFISKIVTANLELAENIGINMIQDYNFSYYAIFSFGIGIIFLALSFFNYFTRK
ncbi:hypothetical protein ACQKOM_14185 [Peribacillus frigoritolerans]|uniref:hypothetical protein n=1 Tax=Peribacillus TaxID=2675229 RepID=UPI001D78F247|nr:MULTISPECIES: hypothetical protein [Peribacillus]MCZ0870654.1 hypothetical protein [Peribacillus sp. AS_2]MED3889205.1 hypothetical protein [Peribacillus frigoritolerans]MED4693302.1 hypothetical protein [Peribacillus frigoritolerans]CAH0315713.1 hypothetical protein SRABI80_04666 [Peribacillus frigoritolerans]